MPEIYVTFSEKEKALVQRVAAENHLSASAFCRQASLEKALGHKADSSTSDLLIEIEHLKAMVQERNRNGQQGQQLLAAAASIEIPGASDEEIRGKILHILSTSPPLNTYALAAAVRYPEKLVFLAASKLVDQGLVVLDERTFEYRLMR